MRKTLFWLFSAILFLVVPAVAQHGGQHGGHAGGNHDGGNGGQRHESQPRERHESQPRRQDRRQERGEQHGGYNHGAQGRHEHWDGRHFDRDYFRGHWGRENRFYWGRCNWYGPRFYVGSYFWYNDAYFVITQPVPYFWYEDAVYVDEIDGVYYLINPLYSGVHILVNVRF